MTTVAPPAPTSPVRRPVAIETLVQIAGYAGAVLAIVAIAVLIGRRADVGRGEIEAVIGLIAAVLFAAGFAIRRDAPDAYLRMKSVFWVGSYVAFTSFISIAVAEGVSLDSLRSTFVKIAVTSSLYAVVLYVLHRRLLQQVVVFQALVGLIAALAFPNPAEFFYETPDFTTVAGLLWLLSGAWFLLGYRGILLPKRTALLLGALGLLFSPLLFTTDQTVAEILVLLSACGLIAIAGVVDDWAVAAIGIAGLLFDAGEITRRHFTSTDAASLTSFVIGIVLFVGAIVGIRRKPGTAPTSPPMPAAAPPPPSEPGEPSV